MRRGKAFAYRTADGRWLRDPEELARIKRLAIPPAYTDVWICSRGDGHLQATGRDARGRKQYRYHAHWREHRDEHKYQRMLAFGRALPRIRARVERDLRAARQPRPTRDVVLATLVRLLDTTFVRIGNDEYAKENDSYGLTTLRTKHAETRGSLVKLRFRGKGGTQIDVALEDPRVATVVRKCQHLPGQELFGWVDDDGEVRSVGSGDVNDWLHEAAGGDERFTAKDFRTWHASVQALELMRAACANGPQHVKVPEIVAEVARLLRNTAAVCRKSYIHPAVLELGTDSVSRPSAAPPPPAKRGLSAAENRLLHFLAESQKRGRAPVAARSRRKS